MANYVRVPEDEAQWECPGCQEMYEDEDRAKACCSSTCSSYRCDACGSSYGEEYEANNCCPRVTEGHDCCECGAFYETEEEAVDCHGNDPRLCIYRCVVDDLPYATEEEANDCCHYRNPNGVLVEDESEHGDCSCPSCVPPGANVVPKAKAPESLETISLPQEDDWESQLA